MGRLVIGLLLVGISGLACHSHAKPAKSTKTPAGMTRESIPSGRPDGIFCGTSLTDTAMKPAQGMRRVAAPAPEPAAPSPRTVGRLTLVLDANQESAMSVLVEHAPEFEACLATQPGQLDDRSAIEFEWTIGRDGAVTGVTCTSHRPRPARVTSCLVGIIEHLRFPGLGGPLRVGLALFPHPARP